MQIDCMQHTHKDAMKHAPYPTATGILVVVITTGLGFFRAHLGVQANEWIASGCETPISSQLQFLPCPALL